MGNILSPVTDKETIIGKTPCGLSYGVSSMQGRRKTMEDAHSVDTLLDGKLTVLGVFDGHGGSYASRMVSQQLVETLKDQDYYKKYCAALLEREANSESIPDALLLRTKKQEGRLLEQALKDAFIEMDRLLYLAYLDMMNRFEEEEEETKSSKTTKKMIRDKDKHDRIIFRNGKPIDAGTTACVVVLTPDHILCANAGDSRAFLVQQPAKVIEMSQDHKPGLHHEERRIKKAGGFVFGGRLEDDLATSRGFGDYRFKDNETIRLGTSTRSAHPREQKVSPEPDVAIHLRSPKLDQFAFVACDGIYDVKSNKKVMKMVLNIYQAGESCPGAVCEAVLDKCLKAGSKDNMSAILVELDGINHCKENGALLVQ